MTPKQKAEELIEKYNQLQLRINNVAFIIISKQCALIAVDELIIQNGDANLLCKINYDYYVKVNSFLFEVKQEIEKL